MPFVVSTVCRHSTSTLSRIPFSSHTPMAHGSTTGAGGGASWAEAMLGTSTPIKGPQMAIGMSLFMYVNLQVGGKPPTLPQHFRNVVNR